MAVLEVHSEQFGFDWKNYPAKMGGNAPVSCDGVLLRRRLADDATRLFSDQLDDIEFMRLSTEGKSILRFIFSSLTQVSLLTRFVRFGAVLC
jgi:hypothetical protein